MIPAAGLPPAVDKAPNEADFGGQTGTFDVPVEKAKAPQGVVDRLGQMPPVAVGFGDRPSGFANGFGDFSMASRLFENPLEGFNFGVSLDGTYDTNPTQGYGGPDQTSSGDFFATLGGTIAYRSKASALTFGVSYNGSYMEYFSQSELSGYNQGGSLSASYQGGSFTGNFNLGVSMNNGANRYYQAVVNELSLTYSLSGSYRMSAKTSLNANFGQNLTDPRGGYTATGSFNAGLTAMWHYSDRTQFGPGIRYSADSGTTDNFRTTIGPTVSANYMVDGKISLNSTIGLNFEEYDQGENTTSPSASIGVNYKASALWGMSLNYYLGGQANPTMTNGSQEISNLSLNYYRTILRATWNLGVRYEMGAAGTYADPNGRGVNSNFFSVNTGLSMPVFANRAAARISMSWDQNGGGYSGNSGDNGSFQAGAGLSWSF